VFLDLNPDESLRTWQPLPLGTEARSSFGRAHGAAARIVRCAVDPEHLARLGRDEITASVHYVHFRPDDEDARALAAGPVVLAVSHENYQHEAPLTEISIADLLGDRRE
jgi:hypothetical protein